MITIGNVLDSAHVTDQFVTTLININQHVFVICGIWYENCVRNNVATLECGSARGFYICKIIRYKVRRWQFMWYCKECLDWECDVIAMDKQCCCNLLTYYTPTTSSYYYIRIMCSPCDLHAILFAVIYFIMYQHTNIIYMKTALTLAYAKLWWRRVAIHIQGCSGYD